MKIILILSNEGKTEKDKEKWMKRRNCKNGEVKREVPKFGAR